NLGVDATDCEVHLRQTPSRVVGLLTVNGDVAELAAVGLDELFTADEHPARTAAGVVDAAFVRGQHFDENADDVRRRVELTAFLTLGACELGKKILVYTTKNVLGTRCRAAKTNITDQIDELTESLLVQTRSCIVLWQDALERWIVPFDLDHC